MKLFVWWFSLSFCSLWNPWPRHRRMRRWHSSCWPGCLTIVKRQNQWMICFVGLYVFVLGSYVIRYDYIQIYTVYYDVCSHMNCDSWFKQINVRYVWCWIHFFVPMGRDWWHVAVVGSSPGGMPWQARASLRSGRETQMVSQWVEGKISPGNMMKHCETLWNIMKHYKHCSNNKRGIVMCFFSSK
jgi:hypothetical protein